MYTSRSKQPVSTGLGVHYTSPIKPRDKKKRDTVVEIPGQAARKAYLERRLAKLTCPGLSIDSPTPPVADEDPFLDLPTEEAPIESVTAPEPKKRRLGPDPTALQLFDSWKQLLPSLTDPLLRFSARTVGSRLPPVDSLNSNCRQSCTKKTSSILCLFFDYFQSMDVTGCTCNTIPQVLVENGLFPTSPSQPRIAVSVALLDFYRALFEQSCDAVNALASALHKVYRWRGFQVRDKQGASVRDPFWRSLAPCIQWYEYLRAEIDTRLDKTLADADHRMQLHRAASQFHGEEEPRASNECARVLQKRCPACFGGSKFGHPLNEGGDIHVAIDGNFHHRHQRSAGNSPHAFEPQYVLSKSFIDDIGNRIESVRGVKAKPHGLPIPDEAINECERTHEAADGRKQKTSMDTFDDTGVMALVCRHDIPLFMTNIDSPGEQQKYSIALIQHLFSLLPLNATVVTLYDVGCVLNRSLHQYDILPESIVARLKFCTTAMHAYGHQWSCQLVYNPRLQVGTGLTDGEGVERFWSRMRKLIVLERSSSRLQRLWLLDRQAFAIGQDMRDDLGYWIQRRQRLGVDDQGLKAQEILDGNGTPVEELRAQWENQRAAQLSIRAHAPARLKRELDAVLDLQHDLEEVEHVIQSTRSAIAYVAASPETDEALESLERSHKRLMGKVEALYSSLNIPNQFPDLHSVDLEFVWYLFLARDLKINIRKRAISSLFEWERLDRAVGGKAQPLGTKLHQQTRQAIAKRTPALKSAIRKFNDYCEKMRGLHNPAWSIPVPQSLPTELSALRESAELMQDVWISPSTDDIPRWLEDAEVREGIRAFLKEDRCQEEHRRLNIEAENLSQWLVREVAAVELALRTDQGSPLATPLYQYREHLHLLQENWIGSFISPFQTECNILLVTRLAETLTGNPLTHSTFDTLNIASVDLDIDDGNSNEVEGPDSYTEETFFLDVFAGDNMDENDILEARIDGGSIRIVWSIPHDITIDQSLLVDLENTFIVAQTVPSIANRTRVFIDVNGCKRSFGSKELEILNSPIGWLNDSCINDGAAMLQYILRQPHAQSCAIMSTFVFPILQCNQSNDDLWRHTRQTLYWHKDVWIIPIHRPKHWTLCLVYPRTHHILFFDSLAARAPWEVDILVVLKLILRLHSLTHHHGHPLEVTTEGWTASPLSLQPMQTTTYDCGLWVLAVTAAVLRGYQFTGLLEVDMRSFRRRIYCIVSSLPHEIT